MYSAKKVRGRKLYELARRGIEVERAPARVMVYELEARRREGALLHPGPDGTCDLAVRVVCSAGTYVRALAERLGERLGTGAHLASLRRTRAGDFHLADAVSLARLETMAAAGQAATLLLPLGAALSAMPFLHLNADEARQAQHGAALHPPPVSVEWKDGDHVKLCDGDGRLIAVGVYDCERRLLRPRIVFGP
jgi:tRNA pseudouridine55 synthase